VTGISLPFARGIPKVSAPWAHVAADTLRRRRVWIAVALMLAIVAVAHGYNMLHYPYLEDDEGTYFSQAFAVFHLGRLAPETYIYDHAPFGWIQIAVWQLLTDGARFGYGLASGRVLMLLFQLGSALLVFGIGRRVTGKVWVGLLAAALSSLLPFGMLYQRRILLDNIATFWILASFYALTGPATLRRVWFSAAALAVAVLSKEIAIVAFPTMVVLVSRRSSPENRLFAVTGWLAVFLSICSTYVLLALLKGELFPAGTALGGSHPHVSLICSLMWQSQRGADGGLLSSSSAFWHAVGSWLRSEPLLVIGGSAAVDYLVLVRRRDAFPSMLAWTVISFWLFLGRGGIVQDFYLVPALPLLALCLVIGLDAVVSDVRRRAPKRIAWRASRVVLGVAVVSIAFGCVLDFSHAGDALWTANPVGGQEQAVAWVDKHVPRDSHIFIDNYMWYDLHEPSAGRPFPDAIYYWNVGFNPTIRKQVFDDNWRDVDYVITTPQMIHDTKLQVFPVVTPALEHSESVRQFDTGGWTVDVRKVNPRSRVQLPLTAQTAQQPSCMTYGS
jgi:4-amino-4-deoxy-L-arabinose transferase-like glycosyltransferase